MKIALGQINPTVGDFSGNAAKIIQFAVQARSAGAGLILFPELSVCGYPPRDLVERPSFVARNRATVERIAAETQGIAVICGMVTAAEADSGKKAMNSAALLREGRIEFIQSKMLLPTYDVFDEMRNFAPAKSQQLFSFCGKQMALTICEDAWNDKRFWNRRLYGVDPVEELVRTGGNLVLNISASPFWLGKRELRRDMLASIARNQKVPVAMVNQVGGNDSLVFDGSSLVIAPDGQVIAQAKSFEEDLIYFDSQKLTGDMHSQIVGEEASAYEALVLGTRDYVHKCGFQQAIIGLSGGIDSALTASIAADALGSENVIGVGMPGPYSSRGSIDDARALAGNLRIRFELLSINDIYESALRDARSGVCRNDARRHRREHSIACSRIAAHVAFEQVRRAGAFDRQQERVGCRLLHALRRHGRRIGGYLGCAEGFGVPLERLRESAAQGDSASHNREAAVCRIASRSKRFGFAPTLRCARCDSRRLRGGVVIGRTDCLRSPFRSGAGAARDPHGGAQRVQEAASRTGNQDFRQGLRLWEKIPDRGQVGDLAVDCIVEGRASRPSSRAGTPGSPHANPRK